MLLLILVRRKQPEKQKQTSLAVIIVVCGMTGMALNLLYLLNFQEAFGSIYEMVGVMIAANMLGLSLGILAASKLIGKYKQKTPLLAVLITLISVVLLLPYLLNFLLTAQLIPVTLFVTILSGGLIGMIFGFVNRLYLHRSSNAGSVYAFDVFGSSLGALTTCSLLLPVLGLQGTSVFLALLLSPALAAIGFMTKTY
jgi:predicted membrane-bound spermidine synthase